MIRSTTWESSNAKVVNLWLDERNVRLEVEHLSQDAIINDLFQNEDAMQIVESIVTNGFFNNELPVVFRERGKLIVLEGNRRVAALKAILNPSIVPAFEKRIERIVDGSDVSFFWKRSRLR